MNRKSITDMVCNVINRETTPGNAARTTDMRLPVEDPQVAVLGLSRRRQAQLKRMIEFQERVVLKMINGDPQEFLLLSPARPRLGVVK